MRERRERSFVPGELQGEHSRPSCSVENVQWLRPAEGEPSGLRPKGHSGGSGGCSRVVAAAPGALAEGPLTSCCGQLSSSISLILKVRGPGSWPVQCPPREEGGPGIEVWCFGAGRESVDLTLDGFLGEVDTSCSTEQSWGTTSDQR